MQARNRTPDTVAGIVSDAVRGHWVDTRAPAHWRPYLRMSRADRPIGWWLLLLPCWWGLGLGMIVQGPEWRDLWLTLACLIGAITMRGAGCTWNDITDREFDALVERTRSRPLPSGQITVRQAYIWMGAQALAGLVVLLTMGWAAIWLGVASLALVAIYPFAKRFTWWPQIFLGLAFNWGALLAYAAKTGEIGLPAIIAYLAGIAWTIFYDTIYAHQDTEDDALIGVKSTARLFGADSPRWITRFAALSVVLLLLAVLAPPPHGILQTVLAICAPLGFAAHLVWQLRVFRPADPQNCLMLFRANRDAGLIVALFLLAAGLV